MYAARERYGCPERTGPRKFARRGQDPALQGDRERAAVPQNGIPSTNPTGGLQAAPTICRDVYGKNVLFPSICRAGSPAFLQNSTGRLAGAVFLFGFSPLFHRGIFGGLSAFLTIFPRFAQGFPHFQPSFPHFPRGKGGANGGKPGANGAKLSQNPRRSRFARDFFDSFKNHSYAVHDLGACYRCALGHRRRPPRGGPATNKGMDHL